MPNLFQFFLTKPVITTPLFVKFCHGRLHEDEAAKKICLNCGEILQYVFWWQLLNQPGNPSRARQTRVRAYARTRKCKNNVGPYGFVKLDVPGRTRAYATFPQHLLVAYVEFGFKSYAIPLHQHHSLIVHIANRYAQSLSINNHSFAVHVALYVVSKKREKYFLCTNNRSFNGHLALTSVLRYQNYIFSPLCVTFKWIVINRLIERKRKS